MVGGTAFCSKAARAARKLIGSEPGVVLALLVDDMVDDVDD